MGNWFSQNKKDEYLIEISKIDDYNKLCDLETELVVEFHWSGDQDTQYFLSLLEYIGLKKLKIKNTEQPIDFLNQ
jgi:hypothetical protein